MTATIVPIEIVCPEWCGVAPADHAAELSKWGGDCIHHGPDVPVADTTGWHGPLEEPRYHSPVEVGIASMATPGNHETAPPTVYVNGRDLSVAQALALADEIRRQVDVYRAAGGVA